MDNPQSKESWRTSQKPSAQKIKLPPGKRAVKVPKDIPPPSRLHDASHVKMGGTPADFNCFIPDFTMREKGHYVEFTPGAPALIEISELMHDMIVESEPEIADTLLPEATNYYATALLWFRITTLKLKNRQPLTQEEIAIIELLRNANFSIPQPLVLQYQTLGNVLTPTGQHLYPAFPPLPTEPVLPQGGFFGEIVNRRGALNNEVHNLYEDLPCLGVASEALQHAISDEPPGDYDSALIWPGHEPTRNLLGYRPLSRRSEQAKEFPREAGIDEDDFPSYPTQTALNMGLVSAISGIFAKTKTFKVTEVNFCTLSETGSLTQVTLQHPATDPPELND